MTVKMIVAVDSGNAIGWKDGRLPWKLKHDMARFKALTTGHTVLMGRKTFESLGRPAGLPNRHNVVVTRDKTLKSLPQDEPCFFSSEENPLKLYVQVHQACLGCTAPDIWIIGGAQIYQQALEEKLVDEIHLTLVQTASGADVSFPVDIAAWKLFVLRQRLEGVEWNVGDITWDPPVEDQPKTVYLKLTKQ